MININDIDPFDIYVHVLKYNWTIKQSLWSRLKGKFTGRYKVKLVPPEKEIIHFYCEFHVDLPKGPSQPPLLLGPQTRYSLRSAIKYINEVATKCIIGVK